MLQLNPRLTATALAPLGISVRFFEALDSTNNEAKRHAEENIPVLYLARTQSAGRGRLGRTFHSPETGLYLTLAYTAAPPLDAAARVTAAAAVATAGAIEALTGKRPGIKWVNDLYLDGGKLAGILAEAVARPDGSIRMTLGIGVNLTTRSFPADLRAPAASLLSPEEAGGASPELPAALAAEITRRLWELIRGDATTAAECLKTYREHLLHVGERIICTRGSEHIEGILRGVCEDYSLLVDCEGGTLALSSGEISVRPIR